MGQAVLALRSQAAAWLESTKASLAAAGKGFTAEDVAAIEAAAAAQPYPEGYGPDTVATPEQQAAAQEMARKVMTAEFPPNGFPADDPRLAPVEGLSLALHAIAGKAIGWSTDDALVDRIAAALGLEPAAYRRASEEWARRLGDDVVLATLYGQLFSQA